MKMISRQAIAFLLAAFTIVSLTVVVFASIPSSAQTTTNTNMPSSQPVAGIVKYFASTCDDARTQGWLRSCIQVTVQTSQTVEVARCSSSVLVLDLANVAGTNPLPQVGLSFNATQFGYILPGGTHQVGQLTLPGTQVDLSNLLTFAPSSLTIPSGGHQQVSMTIAIPCGFPQALVGQSLNFPIPLGLNGGLSTGPASGVFITPASVQVTVK